MIPTLLIVGLAFGTSIHDRSSLMRAIPFGAAVSVLWGVIVGVGSASALTTLEGTAWGLANFVVGAAVGATVGIAGRATWSVAVRLVRNGRTSPR